MEDVIVRVIDLPEEIGAVTVIDDDGDYNVYLNGRRADLERELRHEMDHIRRNDFYSDFPISIIEGV
ncbi:MAG: hypothetical protein ABFC31_07215 [Clostridiaceae bacterium]